MVSAAVILPGSEFRCIWMDVWLHHLLLADVVSTALAAVVVTASTTVFAALKVLRTLLQMVFPLQWLKVQQAAFAALALLSG